MKAKPSIDNCQLCGDDLRRFDNFYDGRQRDSTQWAWMCLECWQYYGSGVGTGRGQEYDSITSEKVRG